ncbi:hypothetical protein O3M35_003488 [Rhynocoris fuscipes]|uniref:G-protein coupled receptors family 1 profile domain-containing protein n=1 Tax=Rhynocoris fuscipes TaxID=488301 RepID=A0AAW1CN77_9HEMI
MCYILPLILISICYLLIWRRVCCRTLPGEPQAQNQQVIHRSKMKVIKMLMVVIILFACSWLPLYVIFTRVKLFGPLTPLEETFVHIFLPIAQWLGSSNSCINPILYAFFNKKFRAGFKAVLSSRSCCSTLRYDYRTQMTISSRDTTVKKPPPQKRMTISAGVPVRPKRPIDTNPRSMSLKTPSTICQNNNNNFLTSQDVGRNPYQDYICNGTFV